jgi:hypothetical protein
LGGSEAQYRGCGDIGADDGELGSGLGSGGLGSCELGGGSELGWTVSWVVVAMSWAVVMLNIAGVVILV